MPIKNRLLRIEKAVREKFNIDKLRTVVFSFGDILDKFYGPSEHHEIRMYPGQHKKFVADCEKIYNTDEPEPTEPPT